MLSILRPEQPMDAAIRKEILIVGLLGTPIVVALALLVFFSFLTRALPMWVGFVALIGEGEAASMLIKRVLRLRNPDS